MKNTKDIISKMTPQTQKLFTRPIADISMRDLVDAARAETGKASKASDQEIVNIFEREEIENLKDVIDNYTNDEWKEELEKKNITSTPLRNQLYKLVIDIKNELIDTPSVSEVHNTPLVPKPIELMVKWAQSGKTTKMIDKAKEFLDNESDGERNVVVLLNLNNSLLNNQTSGRFEEAMKSDGYGVRTVSCKDSEMRNVHNIVDAITNESKRVHVVSMCCNATRISDITKLIEKLDLYSLSYKMQIYIDEADALICTDKNIKIIKEWNEHRIINNICLVTATPCSFKEMKECRFIGRLYTNNIRLLSLKEPAGDGYTGLDECIHVPFDPKVKFKGPSDYMSAYFGCNPRPEDGDVWLIPGKRSIASHIDIENIARDFSDAAEDIEEYQIMDTTDDEEPIFDAIISINSKGKNISYWDYYGKWHRKSIKEIVEDVDDLHIRDWLSKLKQQLDEIDTGYRMMITGNQCIGRGLTLSSDVCNISHGIFYQCARDASEMFQIVAREFGYTHQTVKPKLIMQTCDYNNMKIVLSSSNKLINKAITSGENNVDFVDINCKEFQDEVQCDLDEYNLNKKRLMKNTDPYNTVPVVIQITEHEDKLIENNRTGKGKQHDIKTILDIINKYNPETHRRISGMQKQQVVRPVVNNPHYKKSIVDFVNAASRNLKMPCPGAKSTEEDSYSIYIDSKEFRIIVSVRYGTGTIRTSAAY